MQTRFPARLFFALRLAANASAAIIVRLIKALYYNALRTQQLLTHTVDFKELERDSENFTVMYNQKGWPRNAVGDVISEWMRAHPDSPYYVLTDPDIEVGN